MNTTAVLDAETFEELMLKSGIYRVGLEHKEPSRLFPKGQVVNKVEVYFKEGDNDGNRWYTGYIHTSKSPSNNYNDPVGLDVIHISTIDSVARRQTIEGVLKRWKDYDEDWLSVTDKIASSRYYYGTKQKVNLYHQMVIDALMQMKVAVAYEIRISNKEPKEVHYMSTSERPIGGHSGYVLSKLYYNLDSLIHTLRN